ncbi:MAG: FAD-dependent monooxygenase [Deltaproteobacteria bacterium]|nr:FAD-dependent monooxygenase [Deltaproteobacteria bacterium]
MGRVCISGAGPAGMTLGLLLARKGHDVHILESMKDFHREFRGEVLMPLFSQMMNEVGLLEKILSADHLKLQDVQIFNEGKALSNIRFEEICKEFPFAIWMPQPILLQTLYDEAKQYPNFKLSFSSSIESLTRQPSHLQIDIKRGIEKETIEADLVVGAEGRWSHLRKITNMELEFESYGFDIVWFELPRPADHPRSVQGFFSKEGNFLIAPKYPDLLQCGLLMPKDAFAKMMKSGISSMKEKLIHSHSAFKNFAESLEDFSHFHVLQAKIAFAKKWAEDRVVLIGDAAHTMSPIGAIGVSIATGTAIVAADIMDAAFASNDLSDEMLSKIQKIREQDVRRIQNFQLQAERTIQTGATWRRHIFIRLLPLLVKMGIIQRLMKSIMTLRSGWKVDSR